MNINDIANHIILEDINLSGSIDIVLKPACIIDYEKVVLGQEISIEDAQIEIEHNGGFLRAENRIINADYAERYGRMVIVGIGPTRIPIRDVGNLRRRRKSATQDNNNFYECEYIHSQLYKQGHIPSDIRHEYQRFSRQYWDLVNSIRIKTQQKVSVIRDELLRKLRSEYLELHKDEYENEEDQDNSDVISNIGTTWGNNQSPEDTYARQHQEFLEFSKNWSNLFNEIKKEVTKSAPLTLQDDIQRSKQELEDYNQISDFGWKITKLFQKIITINPENIEEVIPRN